MKDFKYSRFCGKRLCDMDTAELIEVIELQEQHCDRRMKERGQELRILDSLNKEGFYKEGFSFDFGKHFKMFVICVIVIIFLSLF